MKCVVRGTVGIDANAFRDRDILHINKEVPPRKGEEHDLHM